MVYTIENDFLKVKVEDAGAQLKSVFDKKSKTELLWQGDSQYWKGRAYNLFPIVGRLYDGKYLLGGKIYEMDRHGFARGKKFYLCDKTSSAMTFLIGSDDETIKSYPFEFIFKVKFYLEGQSLKITYIVTNVGAGQMFYGLGAHPGFNVPFCGGKFEDYEVKFDTDCSPERELFTENYLLAGKREPFGLSETNSISLKHCLFDDDAIVLRNCGHRVTLKKRGYERGLSIEFPNMPFVGLWHTPKTDAPFVCVEPWANLPSKDGGVEELARKENIGLLESGETSENQIIITVNL